MAESLAERLKRIAREKAASAAGGASVDVKVAQPTQAQVTEEVSDVKQDGLAQIQNTSEGTDAGTGSNDRASELAGSVGAVNQQEVTTVPEVAPEVQDTESRADSLARINKYGTEFLTSVEYKPATESTHPLAMAFAELEAGLLARDPEFKTKLRDIHRHLGREPELVTQMTEAEIALIVTGMAVFANAEIVEPAAKKAGKAAVKAASRVVISADDL